MGVFSKKKKISPLLGKEPKGGTEVGAIGIDREEGTATIAINGKTITRKLPKGFDPSDKGQVGKFITEILIEEKAIPANATFEDMAMEKVSSGRLKEIIGSSDRKGEVMELLKEALSGEDETTVEGTLKRFNVMRGHAPDDLPLPQDTAKAEFVKVLNCLHKRVHELAPITADLVAAFECLKLSRKATICGTKEEGSFNNFEEAVIDALKAMDNFGTEVCSLSLKVEKKGLPVPDSSSLTIN